MEFHEDYVIEKKKVDDYINSFFSKKIKETNKHELMYLCYTFLREYVVRPGKRLRPLICIAAFNSVSNNNHNHPIIPIACSLELIHASSLIHDDIMDEDSLRRNQPSMHKILQKWHQENFKDIKYNGSIFNSESVKTSVSMAIILGNILHSMSIELILNSKFSDKIIKKLIQVNNNAYNIINQGQNLDIVLSLKKSVTEEEYLNMAAKKTSQLFIASIESGLVCAKADKYIIANLKKYGLYLSISFQIIDDILDLRMENIKGHEFGSDIKKNKKTLIIIHALKYCSSRDEKIIRNALGNNQISHSELINLITLLHNLGSIDYSNSIATNYINNAKKYLKKVGSNIDSGSLDFLNHLPDYLMDIKK